MGVNDIAGPPDSGATTCQEYAKSWKPGAMGANGNEIWAYFSNAVYVQKVGVVSMLTSRLWGQKRVEVLQAACGRVQS